MLVAGLREVGIDPDSINYEYAFIHYDDEEREYGDLHFFFIAYNIVSEHRTNFITKATIDALCSVDMWIKESLFILLH